MYRPYVKSDATAVEIHHRNLVAGEYLRAKRYEKLLRRTRLEVIWSTIGALALGVAMAYILVG